MRRASVVVMVGATGGGIAGCGLLLGLPGGYYVADASAGSDGDVSAEGSETSGDGGPAADAFPADHIEQADSDGACGVDGPCQPTMLAPSTWDGGWPSPIAIDDVNVYWNSGAGIVKTPKVGGDTTILTPDAAAAGIATDGNNVYWVDPGANAFRVAADGGTTQQLLASDAGVGFGIALGQGAVYIDIGVDIGMADARQEVLQCPPNGDSEQCISLAAAPCVDCAGNNPVYNPSITVAGSTPYWTTGGVVYGCGTGCDGGAFPQAAPQTASDYNITASGNRLMWSAVNYVQTCVLQDGECSDMPTPLCASTTGITYAFVATDGLSAYWTTDDSTINYILRCPLGNAAAPVVVAEINNQTRTPFFALAVDATSVYFSGAGGIYKVAK